MERFSCPLMVDYDVWGEYVLRKLSFIRPDLLQLWTLPLIERSRNLNFSTLEKKNDKPFFPCNSCRQEI